MKKFGLPATNSNRRYFNSFRLRDVPLVTYQKSQKILLGEVTKKQDLSQRSKNRFSTASERGWITHF